MQAGLEVRNFKERKRKSPCHFCSGVVYVGSRSVPTYEVMQQQIRSDQIRSRQIRSDQTNADGIRSHQIRSDQTHHIKSHHIRTVALHQSKRTADKLHGGPVASYQGAELGTGPHELCCSRLQALAMHCT